MEISKHATWILTGFLLGYQTYPSKDNNERIRIFTKLGRKGKKVQTNVLDSLIRDKLIEKYSINNRTIFILTPQGLEIARQNLSKVEIISKIQDNEFFN